MVENEKALIAKAFEAMSNAYAPYSNYHVGASVRLRNGTYITGANIENASYGLSNCAERSALFAVYSQGYRKEDIVAMAIVSDGKRLVSPCGACRQVMVELLEAQTPIIVSNGREQKTTTIVELLPMSFTMEDVL